MSHGSVSKARALPLLNPTRKVQVTLCVLCGLPGSGKTTISQNLEKFLDPADTTVFKVEYDRIQPYFYLPTQDCGDTHKQVESTTGTEKAKNQESWKYYRHQILSIIENLIESVHQCGRISTQCLVQPQEISPSIWQRTLPCLECLVSKWKATHSKLVIVLDDNMYFRSMRYDCFKISRKYAIGFCQVFLKTSTGKAIERNAKRPKEQSVPEDVILKMSANIEPPDGTVHPWERLALAVDVEDGPELYISVVELVRKSLSNPVNPVPIQDEDDLQRRRMQCSSSLSHQADLILRKCVSAWMGQGASSRRKEGQKRRAQCAVRAKEAVLTKLKEEPDQLEISDEWIILDSSSDPSKPYYNFIAGMFAKEIESQPP